MSVPAVVGAASLAGCTFPVALVPKSDLKQDRKSPQRRQSKIFGRKNKGKNFYQSVFLPLPPHVNFIAGDVEKSLIFKYGASLLSA